MEQHISNTSRVRVVVLCLALFSLFVIAPAVFLAGGSNSNAAEQKGGVTPSSTANTIAKARLAGALQEKEPSGITGGYSYKSDVSPRLRDMKQLPIVQKPEHEAADNPKIVRNRVDKPDPVVQNFLAPDVMPATILNFDGIPFPGVACNCAPPDTDGEVGLTQYVQIVNEGYQVFNKATGASVLGPSGITTIWSGFGGNCQNQGDGDPVVLYDQFANRWLISQFAGAGTPTDECIAVSTSSDATGTYTRYAFNLGTNFFDYPHLGVWPSTNNNGYYMSDNVFNAAGTAFLGIQAFAFDRAAMIAGNPVAAFVTSGLIGSPANNGDPMLPADVDGSTPPPANTPCPFVEFPDTTGNNAGTYRTWLFHPDFVTPASSTFTQRTSPASAGFAFACTGGRACVPQPAGTALDGIADRLMFRLPYRIIGGVERVVGNFTVASGGVTGVRWFELRNVTAGVESVFQESTYQPDTTWRWMGSIAQDQGGNMALGFSASSSSVFASVRYAGRLIGDPVGTLGQGEATLFAGLGSQSGTGSRWGDYSAMSIDPVDDCTFWYTQEYYPAGTTTFNWRTRIGNFKFPTCNGAAVPVVTSAGATLVSESCTPANGVLDPNETVTVSFCVQNVGTANTTNLVGTLQPTGGVSSPSGPQNYGVVVASGPAVCRNFTFTVSGTCGGTVTATIHFQDGASDLGNVTYTFTLGVQSTAFTENFDGVTAPALPAGWVTAFTNGDGDCTVGGPLCALGTNWTTASGSTQTAPNSAFHNDPSCVTNSTLDTPTINLPASASQLSFRNSYATESAFDGGVLEISINGGAFTDIVTAGGTFVLGGYNATISTSFLSPIAGRMAWSGSSAGFITTTVNLPAASQGQPVKLRFRMASDCSVAATGWNIDTISITGGFVCSSGCPVGTPCILTCPANITKSNDPNQCGAVVTYPAPTSTGTCGTITCTPASGSFFQVGTTTVTCQAATGGGGAKPQTDAPTACSTITQSSSQAITSNNSVSCNTAGVTAENSYYRAFTLSSFGISGAWDIQSVDIGVELANAGGTAPIGGGKAGFSKSGGSASKGVKAPGATSQPITVKLYTSSMPFPTGFPGSLTQIGITNTTVADQALTVVNIPVTGTAPAGSQLVVEILIPDGAAAGNSFFIGSNAAAETGPSYLRAPACGLTTPTTTAAIGFPTMHLVMNVNGCTQVVGTGPTCTFTVTVNDTQPPTITCPANIFVAAAASCPPAGCNVVNFTATASDNCPGVTVVCTPPSGSCFPVGMTMVTCTATDASGNTASCSFKVTVFSACLQDEFLKGNNVMFNTQTGEYRYCCAVPNNPNGIPTVQATGTGVLTIRGCIGTIDDLKGNRKVHIEFDFSAQNGKGKGTASIFLSGSSNPICKIIDQNMSDNVCSCPGPLPPIPVTNNK